MEMVWGNILLALKRKRTVVKIINRNKSRNFFGSLGSFLSLGIKEETPLTGRHAPWSTPYCSPAEHIKVGNQPLQRAG